MAALSRETLVGIVGAGTMGAGIAQVAASAGHPVRLYDQRPGAAQAAIESIAQTLTSLARKGKLAEDEAQAIAGRISLAQELADLAASGLVIEAIVEDLSAKQRLFSELEPFVTADCLFATNTSSLSVTAIAASLRRPERLAGMHFFNPAPRMALVEIVAGLASAPETLRCLADTARAWGKEPVNAQSTPGFIVNRVARPFYGEALRLLAEGATDTATLDALMRGAGGFRMGPCELMDLIGHDVNFEVTRSVWEAFFYDPRYQPSWIQQELVAAGRLGRKSGRGFYEYGPDAVPPAPTFAAPCARPDAIALYGDSRLAQTLAQRLALPLAPAHGDGRIAECGHAVLYASDGRSATRRAAENGVAATVLVDEVLDEERASCLALTSAAQCAPGARRAAIGALQAAGYQVAEVADVPGLIVLRTIAMLANEAAEAVRLGVCTAVDLDRAMCLGVNYPRGPLAWAEAIGIERIVTVLRHLGEHYGEDRYRISPALLQRLYAMRGDHD